MTPTRRSKSLLLLVLWLGLVACSPTTEGTSTATSQPTATTTVTLPPTATETVTRQPTTTVQPTIPSSTPTPTQTPSPSATPEPTLATAAATIITSTAVSFNGVGFDFAPVLGDAVYPRLESMGVISYTAFYFAAEGFCREIGCIQVYPVDEYEAAFPDWSMPPLGAATIFQTQQQPINMQTGAGTRSILMRGQDAFFANNQDLVYDFHGYTNDGQYYVSIIIPIDAPILLSAADPIENRNPDAIPVPADLPSDPNQLITIILEYNQQVAQELESLPAGEFSPNLELLDALVSSLHIEAPPQAPSAPPATGDSAGPFQQVTTLPSTLTGEVLHLHHAPDDHIWVASTYNFARWDGTNWQTYLPTDFKIQDLLVTLDTTVWLAADFGIVTFDGNRWRTLTPADMGMNPPLDPDAESAYTLALVDNQVWVGRCDWTSLGPMHGSLRWFDGMSWQGAESPAGSTCVTAIQPDPEGHVWLAGVGGLNRYNQTADSWESVLPPEAPADLRLGYVTDLVIDPEGDLWPLYSVCQGVVCDAQMRYWLDTDTWYPVYEFISTPERLLFDSSWTPWLFFLGGTVRQFDGVEISEPVVVDLVIHAVTADDQGRIWAVGRLGQQEAALWLLDAQADTNSE